MKKHLRYVIMDIIHSSEIILIILAVPIFTVIVVVVAARLQGVPYSYLTRDVTSVASIPIYAGIISEIGLFMWSATASVCIFSARALITISGDEKISRFLTVSGLWSIVLGVDDYLRLHEDVLPYHLGVPELATYSFYATFGALYIAKFYKVIFFSGYSVLGLAFLFFFISMSIDLLYSYHVPTSVLNNFVIEDIAKFSGIVAWFLYFFRVGSSALAAR